MEQSLDLCITLTPPPPDAPPETIAGIELRCDQLGLRYAGDLLADPFTAREKENIRWYLEEYADWPYELFLERGKKVEASLAELGKRLYAAICASAGAMSVVQPWRLQPGVQRQISIVSDVPRALSLPWELLHDEQGFLVLRTRNPVSLIRRLPQRELGMFPTSFEPPLRILLVTARPDDAGFIDPRSIAHELLDEMQKQIEAGAIALEFLRPPTLSALRARLSESTLPPIQVLHFDGHGVFLQGKQEQGMLAFEDEHGRLDLVKAEDMAQVLQDSGVRLAVLTACQSALGAANDAFSSVAAQLIRSGVDAVTAMSASVLVVSATRYAEAFYRVLATGVSAPVAQERARQALHDDPRRHILRRKEDDEGTVVTLRDWWLPHYYQQRPVSLQPTKPTRKRKKAAADPLARLSEGTPAVPRYGFCGRAHELLRVERFLLQKKVVVIYGFGGMGKTALAREAADWLTRTKMYQGACFVSFEHRGDAATLLSGLGNYLNVYDGHYDPNEAKEALARLKPVLENKPFLVIADNLESILPGGDAVLEPAERTTLWNVLLDIAKMGAGILLTSRNTAFGDGRLAPGNLTAHLLLQGLHPNDSYALASQALSDLGIDRAQAPYGELRALLAQLDHHPLAIQVVLPALRERSLTTIRTQFTELLPTFSDDTTTGRNRSLLASLDYSLQRLNPEQRSLLSHLAIFEGGADEASLLAITQIPAEEWATLRSSLEQAALLTAEQVHQGITATFLHFHPVLVPYLRWQAGTAADPELCQRYVQRYAGLANYLYHEDFQHPQPVGALVRRELPNLRRALVFLLQEGEVDAISEMVTIIASFLTKFGMMRERDQLRQRAATAVAVRSSPSSKTLTRAEYLREIGMAKDEQEQGNNRAALARLTLLLARLKGQPQNVEVGPGSFYHSCILQELGHCLIDTGQYAAAEARWREALGIVEALIQSQPDQNTRILHPNVLNNLGTALERQGHYAQAQHLYEQALTEQAAIQDIRNLAITLGNLGDLALELRDYARARTRYQQALEQFRVLGEPALQAIAWQHLGAVAEEQGAWAEAERCYRESLILDEQQGNIAGAATTCNQLGIVAKYAGRPDEAEGWYLGALRRFEQVEPGSVNHVACLNNLANLLVNEVRVGRAAKTRLIDARNYAEQVRSIDIQSDVSAESWTSFSILAEIADLQDNPQEAQGYRQQERESYAAFAGNRYHIQQQFVFLIAAIVAATGGEEQAQALVKADFPQLEGQGWHIRAAVERIWGGERDWQALTTDLDGSEALLILLVLEALEESNM